MGRLEPRSRTTRRHIDRPSVDRARRLRESASVAEEIVWKILRGGRLGFKFRRQHPIGGFVLDFYCHEAALAIEFDGEQHDPKRDARRDAALLELNVTTLRIPNRDFFMLDPSDQSRTDWIEQIIATCEARTGRKVRR